MPRLLFEKTGSAVFISHLDLMRLFQRGFKRAGLLLKHTQGFNPRPSVSIALPLSVGVESRCELLDFELEGEKADCKEILDRLNPSLICGIRVLDIYEDGRKLKDLAYLRCQISLEYDAGCPEFAVQKISDLFKRESILVEKRGKNGVTQQDIIPMIRRLTAVQTDENTIGIDAVICCQNPTLNPAQIVAAIVCCAPELAPDFARFSRVEIYDHQENVFR